MAAAWMRRRIWDWVFRECAAGKGDLGCVVRAGCWAMRLAGLHHHFYGERNRFGFYSLFPTARDLALFALRVRVADCGVSGRWDSLSVSLEEARSVVSLFERRIVERIPVEYITHRASYAGLSFFVNKNVLTPRSLMANRFKDFLALVSWKNHRILDLCTGSGCIGITLALLAPQTQVDLVDISQLALEVADVNVRRHHLEGRVRCLLSDGFDRVRGTYDLIISNPPYVSSRDHAACPREFLSEPKIALVCEDEGLAFVDRLLVQAKDFLSPQGTLIVEVGMASAQLLKKKYPHMKFQWFPYRRDDGAVPLLSDPSVFLLRASDL